MKEFKYFEDDKAKYLETVKKQSVDLFLYYCGIEKCTPSYSFGPAVRPHYLVHYVLEGEGSYEVNGKTYHLKKNQGFLIPPDTITYYEADKDNPWTYIWIGFNGVKAETYLAYANLNLDNPIFEYNEDDSLKEYVTRMLELNSLCYANELELEGLLYLFMSKLARCSKNVSSNDNLKMAELYIEKSVEFIENNYSNPIKINDIANYIGLNRSYLTHIFKKNLNVSPQEFLLNFRIEKACDLLKKSTLSIGDISRSVGYNDPLTFSKIFKKVKGTSPKNYRDQLSSALTIY